MLKRRKKKDLSSIWTTVSNIQIQKKKSIKKDIKPKIPYG